MPAPLGARGPNGAAMQTRTFEARVDACPDDVWAALTDPEVTRRFFFGLTVDSDWQAGSPIVYHGPPPHHISGELVHVCKPNLLMHSIVDGAAQAGEADALGWITWTVESHPAGGSTVCVSVDDLDLDADPELDQAWCQVLTRLGAHFDGARKRTGQSPTP
jgi:uncharacterized protein YndB with AHSA1/START domain